MKFHPHFSIAKRLLRLRKKPIIARRLGARWELYPRDWIDNRLLIGQPFERPQLAFAQECIRTYKLDTFFDCGANIGLYSILLGLRSSELKHIHSFEPVPPTHARLVKNIRLNELSDKVIAHPYGLGDAAGCFEILLETNSSGTASLDMNVKNHPRRNFHSSQEIEIRIFDSQFSQTNIRPFFKIDVEGFEAATLRGMEMMLKQNQCVLQVELWDEHKESVTNWLSERGYHIFHQIDGDYYFCRTS